MGLFGDKTEISVALDRADVMAGELVVARVRVGQPDKKAQSARVELLYRNTHKYDTTDSDGDRVTRTQTVDVVVAGVPMMGGGPPQAGENTFPLTVPPGAPGTAAKSIEWFVRAVVDRRMGADSTETAPLMVRVPAQQLATWAQEPPRHPSECSFVFDGPRFVRPGERLSGTLSLRAAAPISARALKVCLRRVRYDPDRNTDEATAVESVLLESPELAAGQILALPIALDLPADAPPSFHAAKNSQCWYLDAVFDRKLKSDIVGRTQVVVHTI